MVGYYVDHNHDDRYYTKSQIDSRVPITASVELPVGVTITAIVAMMGNGSQVGFRGGSTVLFRRTLGSVVPLASVDTFDLPTGTYNQRAALPTPEVVSSGRYYFLRYTPNTTGSSEFSVCGAEISYTNPG